jgi:hypothetical protein
MLNDGYIYLKSTNGDFAAIIFSPVGSITERHFFEEIVLLCSKTGSVGMSSSCCVWQDNAQMLCF